MDCEIAPDAAVLLVPSWMGEYVALFCARRGTPSRFVFMPQQPPALPPASNAEIVAPPPLGADVAAPPRAQPPAAPPQLQSDVAAPPLSPPPLPLGVRVQPIVWWPRANKVSRRLGHLLENWQLEIRARATGFSLSLLLHALIFVTLALIAIPVTHRIAGPTVQADFRRVMDSIVGLGDGDPGPPGTAIVIAPADATNSHADPTLPATPAAASADAKTNDQDPPQQPAKPDAPPQLLIAASTAPASDAMALPVQQSALDPSGAAHSGVAAGPAGESVGIVASGQAEHAAGSGDGVVVSATAGGLEGRSPVLRGTLLARFGGNLTSEAAVARGLVWLKIHQRADGSWQFNHQSESCHGYCGNPGNFQSIHAATGLALLPFLGAGNTHLNGEYRETVRKGIYFLAERMKVGEQGGDLHEDTMYAQGLATIALCECYAMSKDENLKPYAQSAVDFIVHGQDPNAGGWRYSPLQPGDTTVTGWQLMALKSAVLGGLDVPPETFRKLSRFLDSVQMDYGAGYGYLKPGNGPTTSAIGVLARMLTGWRRDQQILTSGVKRLDKLGPSKTDMYFNYYATQAMRHYGGAEWERWNRTLRDQLIASQSNRGHEAGSWYQEDKHGEVGGRLYITATSIMTLEVYYRYMPLYSDRAAGN